MSSKPQLEHQKGEFFRTEPTVKGWWIVMIGADFCFSSVKPVLTCYPTQFRSTQPLMVPR